MNKKAYILLALLLPVFAVAKEPVAPSGEPKPISETKRQEQVFFFHEGKKRVTFGDVKGAEYCYLKAIKADPWCDACYYELAGIAAAEGDLQKALSFAQSSYRLDTTNVWYCLRVAQLFAHTNDLQNAQKCYEQALVLNPKQQAVYGELLLVYEKQQAYDKAIKAITLYQQNFGVDETSLLSRQNFLVKQGKIKEAIADVKTLLDQQPSEQQYWLLLAELYGYKQADTLAFAALNRAKLIDSTTFEYQGALSDFYRRTNNFDGYFYTLTNLFQNKATPYAAKLQTLEFLQQFPAVEQSYAPTIDSLYIIARAKRSYQLELFFARYLAQTQRLDKTLSVLKLTTLLGSTDTIVQDVIKKRQTSKYFSAYSLEALALYDSWNMYLDILIANQAWKHLLYESDNYAAIFPDVYKAQYLKGLACFQVQSYDDALNFWHQSEKNSADADTAFKAQLYSSLGDIYFIQKKHSKSDRYYQKSLKESPHNILVLNNYAYYLSLRKTKLKKALSMSEKAIAADPKNPTYLDTYAWILYEMGRYEESKTTFQRALALGGSSEPVMLEHYGDVLYALKDFSTAKIYWQRAAEKGNPSPELQEKLKRAD